MFDLLHPHLSALQLAAVSAAAFVAVLLLAWAAYRRLRTAQEPPRASAAVESAWDSITFDWPPPPAGVPPYPRPVGDEPRILREPVTPA